MIARALALLLLAYLLGFIAYAFTLERRAPTAAKADAAIVLTGGSGRIERGIAILKEKRVKRVLVAGADPSVRKVDLVRRLRGDGRLVDCCVDLETVSVDTRSNAVEAERWMKRKRYRSAILVTSDWHMRRARYEFERILGREYELSVDAVRSEPKFVTLFGEYTKYVLRRLSVWIDL